MITINKAEIYDYDIPFKRPLRVIGGELTRRRGVVIKLTAESGAVGYGEIAPLDGFSVETVRQARGRVLGLVERLPGSSVTIEPGNLEEMCRFSVLEGETVYASVLYGLEAAAFHLFEIQAGKLFQEIFTSSPGKRIPVNGLLHTGMTADGPPLEERVKGLLDEGFTTIKIKVGRGKPGEDIEGVNRVSKVLPSGALIRLDANRLWDYETALEFSKRVDHTYIEYIEEPFKDTGLIPRFYSKTGLPVALDESLLSIQRGLPPEGDGFPEGIAALVLKPTLLGGITRTMYYIDVARRFGYKTVISSCFEAGPAYAWLLKMAATIDSPDSMCACGLDTLKYLDGNLFSRSISIKNGTVAVDDQFRT